MERNFQWKKTKIVATIGLATQSKEVFEKLVDAGLNVARLNFSHGDHAEHGGKMKTIRAVSEEKKTPIAILQDLGGPKIRIGEFYKERVMLEVGKEFTLTTDACTGDEARVWINYPALPKEIRPGAFVLLDDGKKKLEVLSVEGNDIRCRIIVGGETKGRRGVNLPGTKLAISSLTEKDRKDLDFGLEQDVDFVALSFVRRPEDILELRAILDERKSLARIIAKIETTEAIECLEDIIRVTDGVMVARGDLAVEVPKAKVPHLQKQIIKIARRQGKPVIVATQMLESMIHSPVPTRAEVSDVANAILDGADAVMLSEETALGEYPVEAVSTMAEVALEAEQHYPLKRVIRFEGDTPVSPLVDSVTSAANHAAKEVDAKAIIALTETGFTARMLSRFRPMQPVLVLTTSEKTCNQLALSFGCLPVLAKQFEDIEDMIGEAKHLAKQNECAGKGDRIVIAAGIPFGRALGTNLLMVEEL